MEAKIDLLSLNQKIVGKTESNEGQYKNLLTLQSHRGLNVVIERYCEWNLCASQVEYSSQRF